MAPDEVVALREAGSLFSDTLSTYFAGEAGRGEIVLPEGPDSSSIGDIRRYDESRLVDVAIVEEPADGLLVSVCHWFVPRKTVLDVFVPAYGDHGVLTDHFIIPLPVIHFRERLESRGFASSWVARPGGHLYASLYDDSFPG